MEIYFEVDGCLGQRIRVTKSHWNLITQRKHPEIYGHEKDVQATLIQPDFVGVSQDDPDIFLYYKQLGKYLLCVVCRHFNYDGFIVTCYLTARVKKGRQVWRR